MNSKALVFILLSLTIITLSLAPVNGQNPFIPKYDAVKRSERCFTVTWEANNQFGAVWWADQVDFSSDTLFNFVVYMGDRDGNGADGLAFVMHQDPRDTITDPSQQVIIGGAGTWDLEAATGDDGGGLGFAMHESRVDPNTIPGPHGPGDDPENHKIQNSVAVEMDTWNNRDVPDGKNGTDANGTNQVTSPYYGWDHTAVIYNGDLYGGQQVITDANGNTGRILPLKPDYAYGTGNNPDGSPYHNIEDDRCYLFQIRWEVEADGSQTMQLWADVYNGTTNTDGLQLIMTHNDDMINNVFGGDPVMRFGFTGSTGGSINEQTICLLGENLKPFAQDDYASIPMNNTAVIDVEANDNDPDGDQLHVPIIMDPARNGSASIFDSLGVNFMRYTPNTGFVGLDTVGYVTCDVNSTKCYAKCDTAFVYIDVGCIPFDVDVTAISPNLVCTDSVPSNGTASANVDATFLRGTLWYEGFEDLASGTTEDNGTSAWSTFETGPNCRPGNNIYVQNFEFRIKVVTGGDCEIVFETEEIDISNVSDVNLSIDLKTSNATYESNDYVETYYILDGGPETRFDVNGRLTGTFGVKTASSSGINGSTLKIVVRAKSSHSSEEYYWDNIHVTAVGAGIPDVTYNWYDGDTPTGPITFTGAVNNTLNHGTYTVVAIDNLTGCPSNPATITIDSAGTQVPGGFIEQLSPFTNCELPYDGSLGAGVLDGTDTVTVGYSFEWYHQEDPKIPSFIQRTGAIAQNLESREYTVVITENSTGCDTTINAEVPNAVTIPTITATKIADITSCSNPNSGIGEANVLGDTTNYSFEWFVGPAIGAGPADYTSALVNTFPVGTYTVRAIDGATSCPSDAATITINDLTANPLLQVTIDSEQVVCDTLAPTGQLSGAVDESGTLTTTGYTFDWYKGPNDIIPARPGYTGGPTADGLEAGSYRLVVIEDGTNCTSFIDTLIQDNITPIPDITLAATDVNSCAAPNGTITVTVVGNPADYTYDVYRGNGIIIDSLILTSPSNVITDLDVGAYTVVARDIITKCITNPAFTSITDATVPPDATIISQDQTSCDPANPTGQLTANMGFGAISDYTYEWFEDNLSGTPITPSSVDGEVISDLDSGDYAIRITNNITQCVNSYYPTVDVGIVLPVEVVSSNPSTFCGANANGQLIATVDGGLTEVDGYTFIWESVDNGDTLAATTATVTLVEPGDFILTVINNATACASNPAPITVDDNTVTPIPNLSVSDNSSCDVNNPNGQIEVTTTNESPLYNLTNYAYAWFDNATSTPITSVGGPNGEIADSLSSGTYELRIQNTTTSCSNSVLAQINDINIKPVIDAVTPDHADNCTEPFMSGATVVSVNGGAAVPAGYTFTWTNLDGGPVIAGTSGSILDYDLTDETLPPGNYEVMAYNEFNCPSDPVTFEIQDNSISPAFSLIGFDNISCDPAPANAVGSIIAARPDNSYTISTYEWFLNNTSGALLATTTPNDSILYNLSGGTYAVRITNSVTGCTSVEYVTIQDAPSSLPVIQNNLLTHLTSCIVDNGELGYQVVPFENEPPLNTTPRTYTFYLNGSSSYNQTTSGTDNATFTGLASGNWNAYVVDNFTNCQSDPITSMLSDAPEIMITSSAIQLPTSCAGNDGILRVFAETLSNDSTSGGAGFTFDWSLGVDGLGGAVASTTYPNNFSSRANSLESEYYFIQIQDLETSCTIDTAIFLPSVSLPDINAVVSPSDRCAPFGNGGISLTMANFPTVPIVRGYADYDYRLYTGSNFDPNNLANNIVELIPGPAAGPVVFTSNLAPGTYTIVAAENFGTCFSDPVTVEIDLNFNFPTYNFAITADKSCLGAANGTGQLEVTSTTPAFVLADFTFDWTNNSGFSETGIATTATLFADNYTLVGEITANIPGQGCIGDSLINLPKVLDEINLIANVTPNNNCAPFDGTIQITDLTENSVSIGGLPGDYVNFNIFDAALAPIVPASGDGIATPWGELGPGNYYLQTQNDITKCFSETLQVTVNDLSQDPEITIVVNSPDYACDVLLANGELEAFATAGSQNTGEYNFIWHQGDVTGPNVSNPNPNQFVASNLTANSSTQLYTVEVIDVNGASEGCISAREYTLVHQPTTVSILSTDVMATDQTICGPNGSISITQITEDDGSGPISSGPDFSGNYAAQLLDNNLNIIDPIANVFALFDPVTGVFGSNDIPAETYYVQASNVTNGCSYGPITQIIVKDVSKNPIISATLDSPDYACVGGINTGQLTAIFEGGTDGDIVTTNFSATWTVKATGSVAPGGTTATNLWPDIYTLTVVDDNGPDQGCVSTRDYEVTSARHDIDIVASGTDQTICIADGTIQIDDVQVNTTSEIDPHLNWTAFLYNSINNIVAPAPVGSGFASNSDPFINIQAGTYFVQAQDNASKCFSNPYQVILGDLSENPVIDISITSPQYSLNPNPLSWTGSLLAGVSETDGSVDTYNMNWHYGLGASNQIPAEINLTIDSLDLGLYTFTAVNTVTGCDASYYVYLPFEYLEPTFNTSLKAKTICSPLDGAIEVIDIALDGTPDQLSDYTFDFHDTSYTQDDIPDYSIPGDDTRTAYDNINSGSYYIIAEENWWMLESYPVQVDVIDSTTNPIINFDATNYHAVTSCDESVFADGALAVEVYEDNTNPNLIPPFSYSYTWHNGQNTDPASVIPGETNNTISGLPSGEYTVVVVNLDNNCQSENTFIIEDVSVTPVVVASQTPNTNCPVEIANGIVTANVINSNNNYSYQWFEGTSPSSSADYLGATWGDKAIGYYTVIATDQDLATCISEPVTIEVEDATVNPTVLINELSPVTNCDPDRPNGALTATTQDGIEGHTFEWYYEGNLYATGPLASDLGLFDYQLTVTNNVTLCQTTMISGPTALLGVVPPPDVDILNDRTSCLEPDGSATATISGNVVDYIFRYYNKFTGEELNNFYEDYTIYDLDTSTYLVTAESRITGCISEPSEFAIANESYFPEIDVIADPSDCQEPNGAANVIISDMTRDFKVTWYGDNGFETQEKEIVYIPVGKYRVEVEGTDGCISSTEAEVKGDVIIYNGVSANNDGLNEFFAIVCLEYFPNNNVKIYNRAGLLVYEQDFYDMNSSDKRFTGISNKGASIIGTELPIGTYFYVVDKNDGTKAKVGYLELNR